MTAREPRREPEKTRSRTKPRAPRAPGDDLSDDAMLEFFAADQADQSLWLEDFARLVA
jgi:hypothetical protein